MLHSRFRISTTELNCLLSAEKPYWSLRMIASAIASPSETEVTFEADISLVTLILWLVNWIRLSYNETKFDCRSKIAFCVVIARVSQERLVIEVTSSSWEPFLALEEFKNQFRTNFKFRLGSSKVLGEVFRLTFTTKLSFNWIDWRSFELIFPTNELFKLSKPTVARERSIRLTKKNCIAHKPKISMVLRQVDFVVFVLSGGFLSGLPCEKSIEPILSVDSMKDVWNGSQRFEQHATSKRMQIQQSNGYSISRSCFAMNAMRSVVISKRLFILWSSLESNDETSWPIVVFRSQFHTGMNREGTDKLRGSKVEFESE